MTRDDRPEDDDVDEGRKTLLTEVLPDPEAHADRGGGSPRQRTTEHLKRILAAAGLALQLPQAAAADTSVPPLKGPDGKSPSGGQVKGGKTERKPGGLKPKPQPQPPDPGYYVVDMLPEPADLPKPPLKPPAVAPGYLTLSSTVSAGIRVDGQDTGLKTPQARMKLEPGAHSITLVDGTGRPLETFVVNITAGGVVEEARDPRPKPSQPSPSQPTRTDGKTK
jgi:hypothetical protein